MIYLKKFLRSGTVAACRCGFKNGAGAKGNSGITAHFRSRLVIVSYLWDSFSGSWQYHFCPTGLRGGVFFPEFLWGFNLIQHEWMRRQANFVHRWYYCVCIPCSQKIRISSTESDKHVIFALRKVADTFSRLFHQVEIKRPFFDLLCRECHRRFFLLPGCCPRVGLKIRTIFQLHDSMTKETPSNAFHSLPGSLPKRKIPCFKIFQSLKVLC